MKTQSKAGQACNEAVRFSEKIGGRVYVMKQGTEYVVVPEGVNLEGFGKVYVVYNNGLLEREG